jgi:hypothetical protein
MPMRMSWLNGDLLERHMVQKDDKPCSTLPPSVLSDISPTRGEITRAIQCARPETPTIDEIVTAG